MKVSLSLILDGTVALRCFGFWEIGASGGAMDYFDLGAERQGVEILAQECYLPGLEDFSTSVMGLKIPISLCIGPVALCQFSDYTPAVLASLERLPSDANFINSVPRQRDFELSEWLIAGVDDYGEFAQRVASRQGAKVSLCVPFSTVFPSEKATFSLSKLASELEKIGIEFSVESGAVASLSDLETKETLAPLETLETLETPTAGPNCGALQKSALERLSSIIETLGTTPTKPLILTLQRLMHPTATAEMSDHAPHPHMAFINYMNIAADLEITAFSG